MIAITYCYRYADFLIETLPTNRAMFERFVVVTQPDDQETHRVAEQYDASLVYNPGRHKVHGLDAAIQEILQSDGSAWVCLIDADILLPPSFPIVAKKDVIDTQTLYGARRASCWGPAHFAQVRDHPSDWVTLHMRGARLVGFLQILTARPLPRVFCQRESYEGGDPQIRDSFARKVELPLVVLHLEHSRGVGARANWHGRITPPWPEVTFPERFAPFERRWSFLSDADAQGMIQTVEEAESYASRDSPRQFGPIPFRVRPIQRGRFNR
jgi:hypothetical protein